MSVPWRRLLIVPVVLVVLLGGWLIVGRLRAVAVPDTVAQSSPSASPSVSPSASVSVSASPPVVSRSPRPVPTDLPVLSYDPSPGGFPADPAPASLERLTTTVQPTRTVTAYDAINGTPRAQLPAKILGHPVIMPVIESRAGWYAVPLMSANRRIAWLKADGLTVSTTTEQIVVDISARTLTWYHNGVSMGTWSATIGVAATPTPLGRTFVFGRTPPPDPVYGGVDILALGGIPDHPENLPEGLRGAHTGIHSWFNNNTIGEMDSDGCVRITPEQQRQLIEYAKPGTPVVVIA